MLKIDVSWLFKAVLTLTFLLGFQKTNAQLAAGDILFTGIDTQPAVSTTGPRFDRVSFVALKEIPVGTVIYFTDRGYKAGTWFPANANTEGTVRLTITSKINAGKEVSLILTPGNYAATMEGTSIGNLVLQTSRLSLGNSGDQLFAFTGGNGEPGGVGAVLIAGLHWNLVQKGTTNNYSLVSTDAGWDNLTQAGHPQPDLSTNNSDIPPGLVAGQSAFWLGSRITVATGYNNNIESAAFNGAGKPYSTSAQIRTAVLNRNNWTRFYFGETNTEVTVPTGHFTTVLPVKLTEFTASLSKSGVLKANWKTASETNNSHFILQASQDGESWKDLIVKKADAHNAAGGTYQVEVNIGTLTVAGFGLLGILLLPFSNRRYRLLACLAVAVIFVTSCAKNTETNQIDLHTDKTLEVGNVIYVRLLQVDLDGASTYSETLSVRAK